MAADFPRMTLALMPCSSLERGSVIYADGFGVPLSKGDDPKLVAMIYMHPLDIELVKRAAENDSARLDAALELVVRRPTLRLIKGGKS